MFNFITEHVIELLISSYCMTLLLTTYVVKVGSVLELTIILHSVSSVISIHSVMLCNCHVISELYE